MSRNKNLNQFDDLIDELKQVAERPSIPPVFKSELRGHLLDQYEQSRFSWGNVRQWAGTAVALGVLALIVFISWSSISRQSGAASAYMGTVDVPGRDEFIVYDQLRIEVPLWANEDPGWAEMTAKSWQSLDGTFFRGEVVDADGKQRIFVQGDGQFLWRGTYNSRVERMETVSLHYFDVYHALAQAEGWAGSATTPPFYNDMGWDGLIESVLRLGWNCEGAQCVNDYLIEPPLGVDSRGGEYEPYGWGVSLIGTETAANGRSLTTYRIEYSPNQDGISSSQYRLVTLDSNNHTVVEVADYDGETLLRRLERVSHQIMTSADLPENQFTHLPAGMGVSFVLPEGRVTAETPLLAAPNGEPEATLAEGTQLTLSGLMNSQLAVVRDGITWQYVTVPDVGQGWVDGAHLEWPLTSDGQLVDLDTSRLPTAVPAQTQLTILQTYQAELQALLPTISNDEQEELERLNEALQHIDAEIARLQVPLDSNDETATNLRVVAQLPAEFGDGFRLLDFSVSPNAFVPGQPVQVNLSWETIARPSADYTTFVHLVDQSGNFLAQTDQSLGASSTFVDGTRPNTNLTLWLPDNLPSGTFSIVVGLYDGDTGQQLPADRPGLYLAQIEVTADTAVAPPAQHAANDVWLIAATQHARTSADDPITLDFTLGYQLESDEEILLQPIYASTDWESHSTGPHTIRDLGNPIPLTKQTGIQTITFTESPERMRQDVEADIDQLVLVMQLYTRAGTDENGNEIPNILTLLTMSGFVIDLTSTEAITFNADGETAVASTFGGGNNIVLTSATQYPRNSVDDPITLIINIGYQLETDEEVILKPFYAHPEWETASGDHLPLDGLGDEIVLDGKFGNQAIAFVEDPAIMREAVGTDQPVLVMQLAIREEDENGNSQLNVLSTSTLPDFALDLTSAKEITYQINLSNFETVPGASVSGTEGNGLTLRNAPGGQQIGVLEEGSAVILNDEPVQESEGLLWQSVSTTIGKGWVVAEFLTYPRNYEPVDASPDDSNALDTLTIIDISPPVGSELHGSTTFTVTVAYNLASLDTANLNTMLRPFEEGPAILTNDVQIISMGERELTYSFEFEPFSSNEPSDWLLIVQMVDPDNNHPTQPALASASPHNLPDDVYHYEP